MTVYIYHHADPVIVARDAHIEAHRLFDALVDRLTELQAAVAADEQRSAEGTVADDVAVLERRATLHAAETEGTTAEAEEAAWDRFENVEITTAEGAIAFYNYARLHGDRAGNSVLIDRAFAHMACVLASRLPTFGRLAA